MELRSGSQDLNVVESSANYSGPRNVPVKGHELGLILNCDCEQEGILQVWLATEVDTARQFKRLLRRVGEAGKWNWILGCGDLLEHLWATIQGHRAG